MSFWERVGLVGISATLAALTLLAAGVILRNRAPWLRILGALTLLWLFVWVSPQIYYTYYRMIIPDLPLQWVTWPPPGPGEALRMLLFSGPQNLPAHSQGGAGLGADRPTLRQSPVSARLTLRPWGQLRGEWPALRNNLGQARPRALAVSP